MLLHDIKLSIYVMIIKYFLCLKMKTEVENYIFAGDKDFASIFSRFICYASVFYCLPIVSRTIVIDIHAELEKHIK